MEPRALAMRHFHAFVTCMPLAKRRGGANSANGETFWRLASSKVSGGTEKCSAFQIS
jgi:hypothetical protein